MPTPTECFKIVVRTHFFIVKEKHDEEEMRAC